jgi:hypothetical protein
VESTVKAIRRSLFSATLATLLALAAVPAAATQWFFSYSFPGLGTAGTPVTASGILTTTDVLVGGAYTITGIAGTRTFNNTVTNNITGLLAPNVASNDNLLFVGGTALLSSQGFAFTVDGNPQQNGTGGTGVEVVYYSSAGGGYSERNLRVGFGSLTVTPVPEPSTWALMLGGLGVLAWSQRRRRPAPAIAA